MLSKRFFQKLKDSGKPLHELAWACGLSPNRLYKITSGIDRPGPNDPRVKALCDYIGMTIEEAFSDDYASSEYEIL
jgi:transcriptional regulator with XRE-family HTH domain